MQTGLMDSEGGDGYRSVGISGKTRSDLVKCPGVAEREMTGLGIAVARREVGTYHRIPGLSCLGQCDTEVGLNLRHPSEIELVKVAIN